MNSEDMNLIRKYNDMFEKMVKEFDGMDSPKRSLIIEALDHIGNKWNEENVREDWTCAIKSFKNANRLSRQDMKILSQYINFFMLFIEVNNLDWSKTFLHQEEWHHDKRPYIFINFQMKRLKISRKELAAKSKISIPTINKLLAPTSSYETWCSMKKSTIQSILSALEINNSFSYESNHNPEDKSQLKPEHVINMDLILAGDLITSYEDIENKYIFKAFEELKEKYNQIDDKQTYFLNENFDAYTNLSNNEWELLKILFNLNDKQKEEILLKLKRLCSNTIFLRSYKSIQSTQKYKVYPKSGDTSLSTDDSIKESLGYKIYHKFFDNPQNLSQLIEYNEHFLDYPRITKLEWEFLAYFEKLQQQHNSNFVPSFIKELRKYR